MLHKPALFEVGLPRGVVAILAGLGYFASAYVSLDLTQGVSGIAAIWPASGFLVAGLLLSSAGERLGVAATVALASMAANLMFGASWFDAAAFTLANQFEGFTVAGLVLFYRPRDARFDSLLNIFGLFAAAILGGLISAMVATALAGSMNPGFFISWFTTVTLGSLIVTPVLLTFAWQVTAGIHRFTAPRVASMLLFVAGIGAVSAAIFHSRIEFALFLPLFGVVVATYVYGALGAALGISATALAMIFGVELAPDNPTLLGLDAEILALQFYLICLLGVAWPLTAMLAEKEHLIRRYADTNAFLRLAERTACVGHWFISTNGAAPIWSEQVYRIHGLEYDPIAKAELDELEDAASFQLYHPDDRDRVRKVLVDAMANEAPFEYEARIVRPDGEVREIQSVGRPHFDEQGRFDGLFGTFLDVTEQFATLRDLRAARKEALEEAAEAKRLAETDHLTGIANRRKALAVLDQAGRRAVKKRKPLCVGIVDIDHFKQVNDLHGHAMGDEVLRRVAGIAKDALGKTCCVGRLGGEEFLLVLPDIHERAAVTLLDLIRARIANEDWGEGGPHQVTVSTGLAQLAPGEDVGAALKAADKALYSVKQSGRNGVRHAGSVKLFNDDLDKTFKNDGRRAGQL